MHYADLEIRLTDRTSDTTAVELRYRAPGSDIESVMTDRAAAVSIDTVALRELAHDPDAYGRRLTEMLFANPAVALAWAKALAAAHGATAPLRVRLALDPTDVELNALRWETLRDPEAPDGVPLVTNQNLLISRFPISSDLRSASLPARRSLRVAGLIANPTDLPRYGFQPLDVDGRLGELRTALAPFNPTLLTRGAPDGPPTFAALIQAVRDRADILVLIAHGSSHDGESFLWLETADGTVERVQGSHFAAQLDGLAERPLLVVLVACRSAGDGSDQTSLTSLAPLLGRAGVPAVVAMQGNVSVMTVAQLLPTFFRELQKDGQVDRALAAARSSVLDSPDWWMPALFLRTRSGRVWAESAPYDVLAGLRMPYRDLDPFTEEQADLFFGRDALIAEGLKTWRHGERRFLAVVGASGSGKSSLAQAGLLPQFRQDLQELGGASEVAIIRPGAHPLLELSDELRRRGVSTRTDLVRALAQTPTLLAELVGAWARAGDKPRTLLLLVDQFEELFTLCTDEAERCAFDQALAALVTADEAAASLVITLRSDFYRYSAELALRPHISGRQLLVRAMDREEMQAAITAPVRQVAGDGPPAFEPGLVSLMIEETSADPGALPLLQYGMGELWRAGSLTLGAYRSFGGVRGALEQRAELLYNDPSLSESDRAGIRQILLELVQLGEGTEDTRRRVALAELHIAGHTAEQAAALLKRLVDARLVTTSEDSERPTVAVSHEALIRGWRRLRGWIDQDREALRIERQVGEAARQWEEHGHEAGYLYSGARLAQAEEWANRSPERVSERVRAFLAASTAERRRAEAVRRRGQIFARATSGLIVLALVIGGLAAWAFQQRNDAIAARAQVAQLQQETLSRRLAEAAQSLLVERPYLSLLLAIEAERRAPVAEADETLRVVLRQRLYPSRTLQHDGRVHGALWSQDESRILSFTGDFSSDDGMAQVWDAASGERLLTLPHDSPIYGARWNHDESRILTFSHDGAARVWDATSGEHLHTISHDGPVYGARWNHDESRILTFSRDGTAQVHLVNSDELIRYACHYAPRNLSQAEWDRYLPGEPYVSTCPNLPPGPGVQ